MEFGLAQGLSVNGQYDQKINDLRYRQQEDRRAKAEAESKAKMFADDLNYQNAINEHDAPLIKQLANDQIKKIGAYYRENPDVMYNPEKLAYLNSLKRELKDNPTLHRGVASDTAYREYLKDMSEVAKNPQQHDTEAYQGIQGQWQNYLKYGNQDGEEAATAQGKKAFLYSKPRDFRDLSSAFLKIGNGVKEYDIIKPGNNPTEFYTKMRKQDLDALTQSAFQQDGRQIEVETRNLGLHTPQQKEKWVRDQIEAGFDKQHNLGDPFALRDQARKDAELDLSKRKFAHELEKDAGIQYTTWDDLMKAGSAKIPVKTAYNIWGGKGKIVLNGDNGTKIDLTGVGDFKPDGTMYRPKSGPLKGQPFITGYVDLPMEEAIARGLVSENSGFNPFDDDKPAPGFGNKVQIVTGDHNGKPFKYAKVLYEMPIDPRDATAKSMYEGATMATKHRVAPQEGYGEEKKFPVEATREDFIKAGYSEDQIQRGVKDGLINLK